MATPSYKERMKAQRAEARTKRKAEQAEWHRRLELSVTGSMFVLASSAGLPAISRPNSSRPASEKFATAEPTYGDGCHSMIDV